MYTQHIETISGALAYGILLLPYFNCFKSNETAKKSDDINVKHKNHIEFTLITKVSLHT